MILLRVMSELGQPPGGTPPSPGQHVASISHEGRFWDVYLEFADDPRRVDSFGGVLCFSPADLDSEEAPVRTTTILIERTFEEVVRKAHAMEEHQLQALLRSALPGDE